MAQISICGTAVIVSSFAEGTRITRAQPKPRMTEDDILAEALWIERRFGSEKAMEFLDRRTTTRH